MKTIDLHTHSTASDGTYSPSELIAYAIKQGLSAVAITDHDTMRGIPEALAYISDHHLNIELVPGIEVSTYSKDGDLHILGLFPKQKGDPLAYTLNNLEHDLQAGQHSSEEAIQSIHEYGGLSVLAHPQEYGLSLARLERVLASLATVGLDGIEAIYTTHQADDISSYTQLAKKYGLLITGGSDFHGAHKPGVDLGRGFGDMRIPYELLEAMKERRAIA